MKVLVVDDSAQDRRLLRYYLNRAGWETVEAQNGLEALSLIRESPPELIISDALMPEMDGFQLLREVKKLRLTPTVPFIIYSSTYMEDRDQELALSLGADAFIVKAKEHDEFWQELHRALEKRKTFDVKEEVLDEEQYLSKYSSVLLRKLEQKVSELEHARARVEETERMLEQDISQRRILMAQVHYLNEELEKRNTTVQEEPAMQTRQELERLSPSFFHDLFAPLREIQRLCNTLHEKHRKAGGETREQVDHILLAAQSLPGLLDELFTLPKIPRIKLHAPLKRISASIRILEKEIHKEDECLLRLRREVERMQYFLDDLLDLVRVKHVELRMEIVDLSRLVREIEGELRKSQPERQVEFMVHQGITVWGDLHLLRIALENLLENAWKFTTPVASPVIEFGAAAAEGGTNYFVRDNGPGFDTADAGRLFVPFRRVHADELFPGTGIGLAIVRAVIERHGGRIYAQGEPGKGATFVFTLSAK